MNESWKAGEIITLGNYPQNPTKSIDPIEWRILDIMLNKAYVTSLYALDAQPYHKKEHNGSSVGLDQNANHTKIDETDQIAYDIEWETSFLRYWLNSDFLHSAFSTDEQMCLSAIDTLRDKVSLLRLDEDINNARLFPTDASTGCRTTDYAFGLYRDDIEERRQQSALKPLPSRASYWLRNKGVVIHGTELEGAYGVVCGRLTLTSPLAVRPVLMIDLEQFEILMISRNMSVRHRFDDVDRNPRITIDLQTNKLIADGVNYPDLYIEIPLQRTPDENHQTALALCLSSAIQGNSKAQNSIGTLFWNGDIFKRNYSKAAEWNRYAANQGLPEAMVDLADAYFNGKGVETDYKMAFYYCLEAAKKDFPLGMLNVGKCYENGWGTERNISEAIKWYDKAAKAGMKEAAALRDSLM